jgi:chloramphenicol 3-O-phosphotransferase
MVIILNGAGSSGKSTIAQRLMMKIEEPTVYHNFDFLIPTLLPHRDSFMPALDAENRSYLRRLDGELYKKMSELHDTGKL